MHVGTRLQNYRDKHNKKVINLSVCRSRLLLTHCLAVPERRPYPWLTLDRPGSRRATSNFRTSSLDMSCGTNRNWCLFRQPNCMPNRLKQIYKFLSRSSSAVSCIKSLVDISASAAEHVTLLTYPVTGWWSHLCLKSLSEVSYNWAEIPTVVNQFRPIADVYLVLVWKYSHRQMIVVDFENL